MGSTESRLIYKSKKKGEMYEDLDILVTENKEQDESKTQQL